MAIADEDIDRQAVSEMLGVSCSHLINIKPYLTGFPKGRKVGRKILYLLAEITQWTDGKDIKAVLAEACRRHRHGQTCEREDLAALLNLSRRLHAGEFATKKQRQAIAFRRMAAKVRQSKTATVLVRPDWY